MRSQDLRVDESLATLLARQGILAASPHNTQPWSVTLDGDHLEIRPDRRRQLKADITGRELFLALGCFWGNVRLAARGLGIEIEDRIDGEHIDVFVRGELGTRDDALLRAIQLRQNNRFELSGPIDDTLIGQVDADGLEVCIVSDGSRKAAIADIVKDAFVANLGDRRFRTELAGWVRSNTTSAKDGMPGYVMGFPTVISYVMPLVMRLMAPASIAARERALTESAPILVALFGDERSEDWMRAGRVYQEMAVQLAASGLTTAANASPIETLGFSAKLRDAFGAKREPVVFFRAGRPTRTHRATPRRDLRDILTA